MSTNFYMYITETKQHYIKMRIIINGYEKYMRTFVLFYITN